MDIACFLRGKTKDQAIEMLENRGFDARIGISVLLNKSLLILENKTLWMHDLLQEMGREIVRLESRGEPGKHSLWLRKDLFHVLKKDTVRKMEKLEFYFSIQDLVVIITQFCSIN